MKHIDVSNTKKFSNFLLTTNVSSAEIVRKSQFFILENCCTFTMKKNI